LQEDEKSFAAAFPDFEEEKEEEEEAEPGTYEIYYLWNSSEVCYRIYKTLTMFLREYQLEPVLMLELIKENNLPLEQTLEELACCHSGYLSEILKVKEEASTDESN